MGHAYDYLCSVLGNIFRIQCHDYDMKCKLPVFGFPTRSNTTWPVQSQKKACSLKFQIEEEEELYYPCSKKKGADQLIWPFFLHRLRT